MRGRQRTRVKVKGVHESGGEFTKAVSVDIAICDGCSSTYFRDKSYEHPKITWCVCAGGYENMVTHSHTRARAKPYILDRFENSTKPRCCECYPEKYTPERSYPTRLSFNKPTHLHPHGRPLLWRSLLRALPLRKHARTQRRIKHRVTTSHIYRRFVPSMRLVVSWSVETPSPSTAVPPVAACFFSSSAISARSRFTSLACTHIHMHAGVRTKLN